MGWSKSMLFAPVLAVAGCSIGADVPAAESAVTTFHSMLDAGQHSTIYKNTASEFKTASTGEKFTKLLVVINKKLGRVKSTKQVGWNDNANTAGHFISMAYNTKFTNGDAVESFTYRITDKKAALVGYNINSDTLVYN